MIWQNEVVRLRQFNFLLARDEEQIVYVVQMVEHH